MSTYFAHSPDDGPRSPGCCPGTHGAIGGQERRCRRPLYREEAQMAIGLQKLSAGSGYEYLTRQTAAMDATGRGHTTLADYYGVKGESPGHWYGGGLAGIGLVPGDEVTSEQMKLLFGAGLNPVTGEQLGRRYAVYGLSL